MTLEAAERRDFYVYILFRADGVTPFYVGKGTGKRYRVHSMPSQMRGDTEKEKIAAATVEAIGKIPVEIAFSKLSEYEAHSAEVGLISALGLTRNGTGILSNRAVGGIGRSGLGHTNEQREVTSAAVKSACERPEVRKRKSVAMKNTWQRPEFRADILPKLKASKSDPDVVARIAESNRATKALPEVKERASRAQKLAWEDEGRRAKAAETQKAVQGAPEVRLARSVRVSKLWEDPEYAERMRAAMRAGWARRKAAAAEAATCA